ncbi:hypothetical protein [Microbacterium excoecariae]|uniref:hypothetical protein n=1 Tax=Microbacterium excoecariae TaxID=2715210 RepID=UPI00140978F0|nr:hypothetical protein [Microbacterium excoecariae]NHI16171.1 hypothetical protein [Microbacterium excoecariae]
MTTPTTPTRPPDMSWLQAAVYWFVGFPLGPMALIVAPELVLGIVGAGIFFLPVIWVMSLGATIGAAILLRLALPPFRTRVGFASLLAVGGALALIAFVALEGSAGDMLALIAVVLVVWSFGAALVSLAVPVATAFLHRRRARRAGEGGPTQRPDAGPAPGAA